MSRYLKRLKLAEQTKAPMGAGSYVPGVILIIGEQASHPTTAPEQQPFCCDEGCSKWLNQKLDEASIPEECLFWINALNNDFSCVDLTKLCAELTPKATLALGTIAHKSSDHFKISFEKHYHPQYWKRFRSKEPYALIERLKELT